MKTRQKWRAGIAFFGFLMFPVIINFLSPVLILAGASEGIVTGSFYFVYFDVFKFSFFWTRLVRMALPGIRYAGGHVVCSDKKKQRLDGEVA